MTFTAYSAEKRSCGDNILAEHQYKKSLGITAKGDTTLLIWLGKNRLDQRDTPNEIQVSQDTVKNFNAIMNQLNEIQSPALNNDETSNNAETKS